MEGQIHISVDGSQKEKWKNHVENSDEYRTLTQLIRQAVEKEIQGGHTQAVESPGLVRDIEDLSDTLERVQTDVRWIKDYHLDEDQISDLAGKVVDTLVTLPKSQDGVQVPPDVEDEEAFANQAAAVNIIEPDTPEDSPSPQTLSAIAGRIGADEAEVVEAIEYLKDSLHPIVEVEIDGRTHYFEEP